MPSQLQQLLLAWRSGEPAPGWVAARSYLAQQRSAVERLLIEHPDLPVYGFTTLLGHLDGSRAHPGAQDTLLQGHLVGKQFMITAEKMALLTATKVCQLAQGGSGIHPATYDHLLRSFGQRLPPALGAWHDSYGCGDVVPGAWWVNALHDSGTLPSLRKGDLIALINGNFVSTAEAVEAGLEFLAFVANFLELASELVSPNSDELLDSASPIGGLARRLETILSEAGQRRGELLGLGPSLRQRAVSERAIRSYTRPISTAVLQLGEAIDRRLGGPSANPLFLGNGSDIRPASQNSFLDLSLTMALASAVQVVAYLMGATQRILQHHCDRHMSNNPTSAIRYVQPPKVAKAQLTRFLAAAGPIAVDFSLAESSGIEDLCDRSLESAVRLRSLIGGGSTLLALLRTVLSWSEFSPYQVAGQLLAELEPAWAFGAE